MPRADATTANALREKDRLEQDLDGGNVGGANLAVVFLTYSSMLSMSGLMVDIMVARPAALARLEIISRPSTRA